MRRGAGWGGMGRERDIQRFNNSHCLNSSISFLLSFPPTTKNPFQRKQWRPSSPKAWPCSTPRAAPRPPSGELCVCRRERRIRVESWSERVGFEKGAPFPFASALPRRGHPFSLHPPPMREKGLDAGDSLAIGGNVRHGEGAVGRANEKAYFAVSSQSACVRSSLFPEGGRAAPFLPAPPPRHTPHWIGRSMEGAVGENALSGQGQESGGLAEEERASDND